MIESIIRWATGLEGIGTELGLANTIVIALVLWLAYRQVRVIRAKVDAVRGRNIAQDLSRLDEMWREYTYRKRREESNHRHRRGE